MTVIIVSLIFLLGTSAILSHKYLSSIPYGSIVMKYSDEQCAPCGAFYDCTGLNDCVR